jgi:hypothetical protein
VTKGGGAPQVLPCRRDSGDSQIKKGAPADISLQRSRLDDVNPTVEFEADEVQEGAHLLALAAYIPQSAVPLSLLLSQL